MNRNSLFRSWPFLRPEAPGRTSFPSWWSERWRPLLAERCHGAGASWTGPTPIPQDRGPAAPWLACKGNQCRLSKSKRRLMMAVAALPRWFFVLLPCKVKRAGESNLPAASPLTEDTRAGHKPIVNLCDGPSLPNCYNRKVNLGPNSKVASELQEEREL